MSELTIIPTRAGATTTTDTEVGADGGGVAVAARVTASGLLARMSKGTVSPIMASAPCAPSHLEFVHTEMVSSIRVTVIVFIIPILIIPVGREMFLKPRTLHGGVFREIVIIVRKEEFPWRNFNVFLGELVRGLKLVLLISTSGTQHEMLSDEGANGFGRGDLDI